MASVATTRTSPVTAQAAYPTRLIPGMLSSSTQPRRKLSSVARGGSLAILESIESQQVRQRKSHLLADLLLPKAFIPSFDRQPRLDIVAEIAVMSLNFLGMRGAVQWLALRSSTHFGGSPNLEQTTALLLLYGALFALLSRGEAWQQPMCADISRKDALVLGKAILWSTALVQVAVWTQPVTRIAVMASAPLNFLTLAGWRRWKSKRSKKIPRSEARNVLIIGAGSVGRALADHLRRDVSGDREFRGYLDENAALGGDVLGRVQDFERIAQAEFIDEVILTISHQREASQRLIRVARRSGIDVKIVPDLLGFSAAGVVPCRMGDIPILTLSEQPTPWLRLFLKRAVDAAISAAALTLSAPLFVAIAAAIKLDSSGPVFYCAPRMGMKGRRFVCHKFRTMSTGAEKLKEQLREINERSGPFFKIAGDPRVTRVGRFLRRYSLDELPQLWNVFRGEMSLVGPRPHPLDDFARYSLDDLRRLQVMPGLTGLWQVTARRDPSFQRNMALDLQYIEQWSLAMDLRILCRTVPVVLQGSGA